MVHASIKSVFLLALLAIATQGQEPAMPDAPVVPSAPGQEPAMPAAPVVPSAPGQEPPMPSAAVDDLSTPLAPAESDASMASATNVASVSGSGSDPYASGDTTETNNMPPPNGSDMGSMSSGSNMKYHESSSASIMAISAASACAVFVAIV